MRIWVVSRRAALALLAGALALSAAGGAARAVWTAAAAPGLPPVMIDPGHGGVDGGTSHGELLEKQITLDVALRAEQYLEAAGVPVELTRRADVDLGGGFSKRPGRHRRDLAERVRRTRECGAAFLVSLHVNAGAPHEEGMMFLYQRGNAAGAELAEQLRLALQPLHPRREKPIGRTNLFLLRNCTVPAVIVEMGFITNAADRQRLSDPAHRDRIAAALAGAIRAHYARWLPRGAPGR